MMIDKKNWTVPRWTPYINRSNLTAEQKVWGKKSTGQALSLIAFSLTAN
jgi:hypothetical protein